MCSIQAISAVKITTINTTNLKSGSRSYELRQKKVVETCLGKERKKHAFSIERILLCEIFTYDYHRTMRMITYIFRKIYLHTYGLLASKIRIKIYLWSDQYITSNKAGPVIDVCSLIPKP